MRDSELLCVDGEDVLRLLDDSPGFAAALARTLARLVAESTRPAEVRRDAPHVLALIAAGPGEPLYVPPTWN